MRAMKDSGIEWIGEIPEEWETTKLKNICRFIYGDSLPNENRVDGDIPVFGSNGIASYHNLSNTNCPVIIIGRKGSYGKLNYSECKTFTIDTAYYIDDTVCDNNLKWLYYMLAILELDKNTLDTGVPGLNREFAYNKYTVLSPLPEQTVIADFLDKKCGQIDNTIEKQQKAIEKFKSYKQSIIAEAVTKGLNKSVPMKDSGIEWIGEIPQEWSIVRLKKICSSLKTGATPSTAEEEYFDGDVNWFTPSDFSDDIILSGSKRRLSLKAIEDSQVPFFDENTIMLVGIGATMGKIGFTSCRASINQQITAIIPKQSVFTKHLMYWLFVNVDYIRNMANFTTLPIINNQILGEILCIMPSSNAEQTAIADYLDKKCANVDRVIERKQRLIDRLADYKKSLIYEAVTGKLEIKV